MAACPVFRAMASGQKPLVSPPIGGLRFGRYALNDGDACASCLDRPTSRSGAKTALLMIHHHGTTRGQTDPWVASYWWLDSTCAEMRGVPPHEGLNQVDTVHNCQQPVRVGQQSAKYWQGGWAGETHFASGSAEASNCRALFSGWMMAGRCISGGACPASSASSLRAGAASSVMMSTSQSSEGGLHHPTPRLAHRETSVQPANQTGDATALLPTVSRLARVCGQGFMAGRRRTTHAGGSRTNPPVRPGFGRSASAPLPPIIERLHRQRDQSPILC